MIIVAAAIGLPLLGGGWWYLRTRTEAFSGPGETEFKEYIRELGEEHDVVAEVEWKDDSVTYLGADYDVDGEHLVLENGLDVELPGKSADPVQLYGVPLIRTSAHVAAPVDTNMAIAAEKEEDGDFKRVLDNGERAGPGEAVADGGGTVVDHEYEWGGTAYSLTSLYERAPAVSYHDLEKQFQLGMEIGRGGRDQMKTLLMGIGIGAGGLIAIIIIFWLLGQIGGGSLL